MRQTEVGIRDGLTRMNAMQETPHVNTRSGRSGPMSAVLVPPNCPLVPSFFLLMGPRYPLALYTFTYYFLSFGPIGPIIFSQTAIGKRSEWPLCPWKFSYRREREFEWTEGTKVVISRPNPFACHEVSAVPSEQKMMGPNRGLMGPERFDGTRPVFEANPADQGVSKSTLNVPWNLVGSQYIAGIRKRVSKATSDTLHQSRRWAASGKSVRTVGKAVASR